MFCINWLLLTHARFSHLIRTAWQRSFSANRLETAFVLPSVQICPFVGQCQFLAVCVCSFEWKSGRDKVRRWMGEKRASWVFSADVCGDEAYIYTERWWSEWRHRVLDTSWNTPLRISNTKGEAIAIVFYNSRTLKDVRWGFISLLLRSLHKPSWKLPSAPLSPSSRRTLGKMEPPALWAERSSTTWWPLSCPTMSR